VFRRRLEYPALKRAVREQQNLFNASVVLIEDKASGTQLIQELIAEGCHGVTRHQPTGDKTMRMHAQTAVIENGFVHIPETAPWLAEYLHELTVFPNGKHDDQADSTAQFLDWFKMPFRRPGHFRTLPHAGRATATPDELLGPPAGATRHRLRANLLGPTHQCRPGRRHRDVGRRRPILYP
jgi:predicted phage terminase large subunit-like protein